MDSVRSLLAPLTSKSEVKLTFRLLCLGLALLLPAFARSQVALGSQTALISHTAASPTAAAGSSISFTVSKDGRYVVFSSSAANLAAGQTDGGSFTNAFLYDRTTGATTLISHNATSSTTTGDDDSFPITISADGRFVAFISSATDLIADMGDSEAGNNIFLYDRTTGVNTLVSHTPGSASMPGNERSIDPHISADGNFIVFQSDATDLITGQVDDNANNNGGASDLFLYNRATGTNTLITHTAASSLTTANTGSNSADISADGRYVTFGSPATNLVAGVTEGNSNFDIFLYDRTTGANTLVSHNATSNTTTANNGAGISYISADGNFVAYGSFATNIAANQSDSNGQADVFLYNRATGANTLVSHAATDPTVTGNGIASVALRLSNDGRFLAYSNTSTNLASGVTDTNTKADAFLFDRTTGINTLISHATNAANTAANGTSSSSDISADGRFVTVISNATNLFTGQTDTNSLFDVFLYDRSAANSILISHSAASETTTGNANSNNSTISADGTIVAFDSVATDLVNGQSDTSGTQDGFLFSPAVPPSLSIDDVNVPEGNSVNFTVTLSGVSAQAVTVQYSTANGSATAPGDYATKIGTLTIPAGQTKGTINVSTVNDTLDELDETFFVNLSAPTNATIADTQGRGIILDNDATPQLSIGDVTLTEGNNPTQSAVFTVTLSAASGKTVTVNAIPSNGTARAPGDYTAGGAKLTFAPGETSKTFNVPVVSDTLSETDETFFVLLSSPVNAGLSRARAIGTIKNDDTVPGISVADISVQEGHFGTRVAVFTLKLAQPSGQIVKVNYATAAGTATIDTDYTAVPSTQVAFGVGATTALARVVIKSDVLDEPNENFKLLLSSPVNATLTDGQATCTINDDDPLPSLSIANASIVEGNSGIKTLSFTVTLTGKTSQAVSVNYTTSNGTATAGSDYTAKTGTLNFAAGETTKFITITVNGDVAVEGNETFFVLLSSPISAVVGVGRGTGTITNDDTAGAQAPEAPSGDDASK